MAKKPFLGLAAVAAVMLLATGCGASGGADPTNGGSTSGATLEDGVPQGSWDDIVAAAKEEGTVNIGLHVGPGYDKFLAFADHAMFEKYGIHVTGSTQSIDKWASQVLSEQAAGQYNWDLGAGPSGTALSTLQPANALQLLDPWLAQLPAETKADDKWAGGFELWADPDHHFTFVNHVDLRSSSYVNRDLVPKGMLDDEDDLTDLLDPQFAGKIVVEDPRIIGNSSNQMTWFLGDARSDLYGEDFLTKLMSTQIVVAADRETLARDFVQGRYPVAIGADQDMVKDFIAQGLGGKSIEKLPINNTGARGVSVLKNAPHPYAAMVMLDWFLSQEGQDAWASLSNVSANSRRLDVEVYSPDTTPDYSKLESYQPILGTTGGDATIKQVLEIAKQELGQ